MDVEIDDCTFNSIVDHQDAELEAIWGELRKLFQFYSRSSGCGVMVKKYFIGSLPFNSIVDHHVCMLSLRVVRRLILSIL